MTQQTPDLTRSAAALIGVSEYADPDLPPIPAAANNLVRLQRVLTDPDLGGWPTDRVFPFHSPKNSNEVVVRLHEIAAEATELMVFYFVGHGSISSPDNEFCMALSDSVAAHPDTGITYRRIQSIFRNCRARVKIVILDSCYSGRAISTLSPPASLIEQCTNTDGVVTLTSADYNRPAHVVPLADQAGLCTSFTGAMLDLVERGVPSELEYLDVQTIFLQTRAALLSRGLPHPRQSGTDTAARTPLFKNLAYTPAATPAPVAPRKPVARPGLNRCPATGEADWHRDLALSKIPQWVAEFATPVPGTGDRPRFGFQREEESLAEAVQQRGVLSEEIVDRAELRAILGGISRRRLSVLTRHERFPRPVKDRAGASGPGWYAEAVLRRIATIDPDLGRFAPRLWQTRQGPASYLEGTHVTGGFFAARWRTPEADLYLLYPLPGQEAFPKESELPRLLRRSDHQPATAVIVADELGLYGPELLAIDLEHLHRRYDVIWEDLAAYLKQPVPWWPTLLRRPQAMAQWRPGTQPALIEPIAPLNLSALLRMLRTELEASPALAAGLHLVGFIRDRTIEDLERQARWFDDQGDRWRGITQAAQPNMAGRERYQAIPDALLRNGWQIIAKRDTPDAAACCLIARGSEPGDHFPFGAAINVHTPPAPAVKQWLDRLVPARPTAALSLLSTDRAVRTLEDPHTGIPVIECVGAVHGLSEDHITYQTFAPLRLTTSSPLRELILAQRNEIWIRTEDGSVYPAPQRFGSGLSWGYGGTGPRTLALLAETLLDDIAAEAVQVGSGRSAADGLIEELAQPLPSGTVITAERLRLARIRNTAL